MLLGAEPYVRGARLVSFLWRRATAPCRALITLITPFFEHVFGKFVRHKPVGLQSGCCRQLAASDTTLAQWRGCPKRT